jgi:surfactin synthase thioesterase subunit
MHALVPALLPYVDREYFLFGHSLGALVAFEFARIVAARDARRPAQLLVSGRIAPQVRASMGLNKMSDAELLGTIERLSGTPRQVLDDPDMRAHYLPLLRADLTINETYEYHGDIPLRCPISVWAGVDDPMTSLQSLRAWGAQTEFPLRLRMLPGNHFSYLRTAEFRKDLVSALKGVSVGHSIESAVREV